MQQASRYIFFALVVGYWPFSFLFANDDLTLLNKFRQDFIQQVRFDLRMSAHITERYLACLKNDQLWFKQIENHFQFFDQYSFCEKFIESLKLKIHESYQIMKINLALSSVQEDGNTDSVPYMHQTYQFVAQIPHYKYGHILQYKNLSHNISNEAPIQELTDEEIQAAISLLNQTYVELSRGKRQMLIGPQERKKIFFQKYQDILYNELPILAYLPSSLPTNLEIIAAFEKLHKNSIEMRKEIEFRYYRNGSISNNGFSEFHDYDVYNYHQYLERKIWENILPLFAFKKSLDQLDKHYQELIQIGIQKFESKLFWQTAMVGGIAVGISIICNRLQVTAFLKSACMLGPGIGVNLLFYWYDNNMLNSSLKSMLLDPFGGYGLSKIDQLDDLRFNLLMSALFIPVGMNLKPFWQEIRALF